MKTYLIHFTTTYQCFAVTAENAAAAKALVENKLAEYQVDDCRHIPQLPDAENGHTPLDEYVSETNPPLFELIQIDEVT